MINTVFYWALLIALLLPGCGSDGSKTGKVEAAPVRVAEVKVQDVPRIIHAVGNVRPSASVDIVPRVAGELVNINFREGQDVREGQVLGRIDPRPYEAALREKQGALARSEAQLAKAREDRRRFGKLVDSGYVSREAFDQTVTDAAALRATALADKAAVENAALELSYCTLIAPISGRIGSLKLDRGNMIKTGNTEPIATIDALSPCYVSFSVPENNLPAIQRAMAQGALTLTATPTGGASQKGTLNLVENNVDQKTGTIRLRASFGNENRELWPGQFVEVRLPLEEIKNALVIPSRAIQTGRDEAYVYTVGDDNRANYQKVRILFEHEGMSVVEADLKAGDKVITEGVVRLTPGMPVKIS